MGASALQQLKQDVFEKEQKVSQIEFPYDIARKRLELEIEEEFEEKQQLKRRIAEMSAELDEWAREEQSRLERRVSDCHTGDSTRMEQKLQVEVS